MQPVLSAPKGMHRGIQRLQTQIDNHEQVKAPFHFPDFLRRDYRVYEVAKSELKGQKIIGTKERGVEPGFLAQKIWTDNDTQKLHDRDHKFHKEAVKFLCAKYPDANVEERFSSLMQDEATLNEVIAHLTTTFPKFTKKHYWKLHYAEPSRGGKVQVDYRQSNNLIHWAGTAELRREKNLGALMEVIANDIYNILGFGGQKLSLRLMSYEDGHPMFVLDGTHVTGPNGETFKTLNASLLQDAANQGEGRIEGNQLPHPDSQELTRIDERQLGSALLKALLMGDRDKVGPNGDNLGYVVVNGVAILMNIDPGKSFEEAPWWGADRMSLKDDVRSDCTFDHKVCLADKFLIGGYKNFSIFSDTTLANRMQGMRDIVSQWPQVMQLFDIYIEFFKTHEAVLDPCDKREPQDDPMWKHLENQKTRLMTRKIAFERVFQERLDLSDDELNLLDNLEKLTSPTTKYADVIKAGIKQEIELKHLRIVDPKANRVTWSLQKVDRETTFSFAGSDSQREKVVEVWGQFRDFIINHGPYSEIAREDIPLISTNSQIAKIARTATDLLHVFSEHNIFRFNNARGFTLTANSTLLSIAERKVSEKATTHCHAGKKRMLQGQFPEARREFVAALGANAGSLTPTTYLRAQLGTESPKNPPSKKEALYQIALMYQFGNGVPQSRAKAHEWHIKAAEAGHSESLFILGKENLYGDKKAIGIEYLDRAATQGHIKAQNELGRIHLYDQLDLTKALFWYEQAAKQGDGDSQYKTGHIYYCHGGELGIERKDEKAYFWCNKAVAQGHSEASRLLELMKRYAPSLESVNK